jgi:hypothetical protein
MTHFGTANSSAQPRCFWQAPPSPKRAVSNATLRRRPSVRGRHLCRTRLQPCRPTIGQQVLPFPGAGRLVQRRHGPAYSFSEPRLPQDISDALSFALILDEPIGADVDYTQRSGATPGYLYRAGRPGSQAELRSNQITHAARYEMPNGFSVYGGLRIVASMSGEILSRLRRRPATATRWMPTARPRSATCSVFAYERPTSRCAWP